MLQDVKAKWFFYGIFVFLGLLMLYIFHPYLGAIFMGVLLALLFHPLYRWLDRKTHWPQNILTLMVLITMIAIVVIPVAIVSIMLTRQIFIWLNNINSGDVQTVVNEILTKLPLQIDSQTVGNYVNQYSESIAKYLLSLLRSIASNIGELFTQLVVFLAIFIVLVPRIRRLSHMLINMSPLGQEITRDYLQQIKLLMSGTVVGSACVSITSATIMGATMHFLNIPAALLFSAMAFIIGFIPYMGTWIFTVAISIIYALLGKWNVVIILMAVQLIIINQIDLLFRPITLPKKVRIHPALVAISVLAGLAAFGIVGLFYGMIIMVLFISSIKIYQQNFVNQPIKTSHHQSKNK